MANMSKEALSAKTLKDLKKLASELNIRGRSNKNKKDLVDLIFDQEINSKVGSPKRTLKDLRQEAKNKGIKGAWKLKRKS